MLNYKKTNKSSSKRSAFTLIELSIVLIIIGLLVAGITGGASLIKAAELRAVMAEARDYKTAASAFLVKYDNLPGDHDAALGGAAGNNNGTIDQFATIAEGSNALTQLDNAEMGGIASGAYNNIPEAAIDTAGWTFGSRAEAKNVVALISADGLGQEFTGETSILTEATGTIPAVTGNQAKSIDRKMDDDSYNTGSVRATLESALDSGTYTAGTICVDTDVLDTGCNITFDL